MDNKFKYILEKKDEDTPIKDLIRREFGFSSRLRTKLKQNKSVYLNGESLPGWVKGTAGDVLTVKLPEESSNFEPEDIPVIPVFEDDDIIIINKPPGYVVHPTRGHPDHTMANGIVNYQMQHDQKWKIRFINRLDRDTSGLLIVGKNSNSQDNFMKQMKSNTTRKRYAAIVTGIMESEKGTIDLPIGRPDPEDVRRGVMEDGYPSVTHYEVLDLYKYILEDGSEVFFSLVELLLETGRTHQIRVHMSYIGHPLLSDDLYGGENYGLIERQALHAKSLSFNHPVTGAPVTVTADLPQDMKDALAKMTKI